MHDKLLEKVTKISDMMKGSDLMKNHSETKQPTSVLSENYGDMLKNKTDSNPSNFFKIKIKK